MLPDAVAGSARPGAQRRGHYGAGQRGPALQPAVAVRPAVVARTVGALAAHVILVILLLVVDGLRQLRPALVDAAAARLAAAWEVLVRGAGRRPGGGPAGPAAGHGHGAAATLCTTAVRRGRAGHADDAAAAAGRPDPDHGHPPRRPERGRGTGTGGEGWREEGEQRLARLEGVDPGADGEGARRQGRRPPHRSMEGRDGVLAAAAAAAAARAFAHAFHQRVQRRQPAQRGGRAALAGRPGQRRRQRQRRQLHGQHHDGVPGAARLSAQAPAPPVAADVGAGGRGHGQDASRLHRRLLAGRAQDVGLGAGPRRPGAGQRAGQRGALQAPPAAPTVQVGDGPQLHQARDGGLLRRGPHARGGAARSLGGPAETAGHAAVRRPQGRVRHRAVAAHHPRHARHALRHAVSPGAPRRAAPVRPPGRDGLDALGGAARATERVRRQDDLQRRGLRRLAVGAAARAGAHAVQDPVPVHPAGGAGGGPGVGAGRAVPRPVAHARRAHGAGALLRRADQGLARGVGRVGDCSERRAQPPAGPLGRTFRHDGSSGGSSSSSTRPPARGRR